MSIQVVSSTVFWILLLLSLVSIILILKEMERAYKGRALRSFLQGQECDPNTICLFMSFTEKVDDSILTYLEESSALSKRYVIYHAPQWKANALRKKLSEHVQLIVDESGEVSRQMGIRHFPTIIELDSFERIIRINKIN